MYVALRTRKISQMFGVGNVEGKQSDVQHMLWRQQGSQVRGGQVRGGQGVQVQAITDPMQQM